MKIKTVFRRVTENWPAKILSIAAAILLFFFYRVSTLEERFFTVPLNLLVNENYTPVGEYPKSARVTIRGAEDTIFTILEDDIEVYVDFSDHRIEGVFRASVKYNKEGTALQVDPLEIKVDPIEVTVELEKKITKSVGIVPRIEGFPAKGYELEQYLLMPNSVEVEGPRRHIEGLKTITTEVIDLSDRAEDFTIRVRLSYNDPFINFPGGNIVEFYGVILETKILKTFDKVDIISLDLMPELTIKNHLKTGQIKVQGNFLLIEGLKKDEITLHIDCSEIKHPGLYTFATEPEVPAGLIILEYEPVKVNLEVEKLDNNRESAR